MLKSLTFLGAVFVLVGCASTDSPNPALTPAETEKKSAPEAEKIVSPQYQKLQQLLDTLGYQGMGLEFESEPTLNMLYQVFSNPLAQKRKLLLIYTGLQMSYDPTAQSLTVGGTNVAAEIIHYLQKNVPLKTLP